MEFSKSTKFYSIGDKIFPVDLSSLILPNNEIDYAGFKEEVVRDKLRDNKPFIVVSEPFLIEDCRKYPNEYYIKVKFEDSEELYCIFNDNQLVFKSFIDYINYVQDAEESFYFGY